MHTWTDLPRVHYGWHKIYLVTFFWGCVKLPAKLFEAAWNFPPNFLRLRETFPPKNWRVRDGSANFLRRRETFTKKLPPKNWRVRDGVRQRFQTGCARGPPTFWGRVRDGSAKKFLMGVCGWSNGYGGKVVGKKKCFLSTIHNYTLHTNYTPLKI